MLSRWFKTILAASLLCVSIGVAFASIPLGAGRKTATGTVEMYGCLQANDYYIINFAAYPVAATKSKMPMVPDCINIAETGETVISLDLLDRDLRGKQVALVVIDGNGRKLLETPYEIPKQGIISTQVNLVKAGSYQAVLLVKDHELKTDQQQSALHIPLTVGMPGAEPAARYTMIGFFVLLGLMIVVFSFVVPKLLKPEQTA